MKDFRNLKRKGDKDEGDRKDEEAISEVIPGHTVHRLL